MHPDFWHERWNNRQIGFHREDVHPYLIQFWQDLRLEAGSRVFVPLCGKSRDMLWLRAQGHEIVGVEVSPLAVQAFFEEQGLVPSVSMQGRFEVYEAEGVRILCGDFFDVSADDISGVCAVYDRASLVALPPEMRSRYARHLVHLLPRAAMLLLVAFEYPQHEMPGPPFSVGMPEIGHLFGASCEIRLLETFDILDQEPRFRAKGVTRLQEAVYALAVRASPGR